MAKKISDDNLFFGIKLTEEQKEFRDAIYDDLHSLVICDSKSGSGKTTVAVACARLLVAENKYDSVLYIFSPVQESVLGYRPGRTEDKESDYLLPLYDALIKINEQPDRALHAVASTSNKKACIPWISAMSHAFLRGGNISNKVVIIDEAQNYSLSELKKVLTRCHDDSKVILIGHSEQIDLKNKKDSGFIKYLNYFKDKDICKVCKLSVNFRGKLAQLADEIEN
jgi:predicted ribonuclease YlaK